MKLIPKNNQVIFSSEVQGEDKEKTASGIFIPKQMKEADQIAQGVVIESGSDEYKKGDVILYPKVIPNDFQLDLGQGVKTFWIINASDISCVIEK